MLAIIDEAPHFAASDYVFSGTGRTPYSGFSKAFARINTAMAAQTGTVIPVWQIYDLRRTAATRMAGLGIPPHVVEACLNHVSGAKAGVAGVYNRHHYASEKRQAFDAWARELDRIIGSNR